MIHPTTPADNQDYFDLLPDPIVSLILDLLMDAQSLTRCLIVSKRISTLLPLVQSLSLTVIPKLIPLPPKHSKSSLLIKSLFRKLLSTKPHFSSRPNSIGPALLSHWIANSTVNFPQTRTLRVLLPDNGGVIGFPNLPNGLLKWSAQFGKSLYRCAVIGATSFRKETPSIDPDAQLALTDSELKTRVVWILSCLIAASARHGVVKETLKDRAGLVSAEILDEHRVGRLAMDSGQIEECVNDINCGSAPIWKRAPLPNVVVKLLYAPKVVLPRSGYVMEGATVVAVRPAAEKGGDGERECEEMFDGGFGGVVEEEEAVGEAVREILKSKWKLMYKLEMNSF